LAASLSFDAMVEIVLSLPLLLIGNFCTMGQAQRLTP
jgi:hypothetical protein